MDLELGAILGVPGDALEAQAEDHDPERGPAVPQRPGIGIEPFAEPERVAVHAQEDRQSVGSEGPFGEAQRADHLAEGVARPGRVRRLPEQGRLVEHVHVARIEPPLAEGVDHRDAIPPVVVPDHVEVGRDEGAEVLAEGKVHRRDVVERPDAHGEQVPRRLGRLLGQTVREVGVDVSVGETASPAPSDPVEVASPRLVDTQEGAEQRRHEDRAPLVRVGRGGIALGVGLGVDVAAQRPSMLAQGRSELPGELAEEFASAKVAAGPGDLVADDFNLGEVLEERHGVGERLVERQDIGVAAVEVVAVQAVEQGVGRLVRDHVERQASEDRPARQRVPPGLLSRGEVAEQDRVAVGVVVGIRLAEGVGIDPQPAHERGLGRRRGDHLTVGVALQVRLPQRHSAQRLFEGVNRGHRHGVGHLLVELRIRLRRGQAVLRGQAQVVQVDRMVEAPARRVVVDDLDIFTDRTRAER